MGVEQGTTATLTTTGRTVPVTSLTPSRAAAFFVHRSVSPAAELAKEPREIVDDTFGDLDWVVPDLREQLPCDGSVFFDSPSQIILDGWSMDASHFSGDAVWCVTLFGGYGAFLAIGGADQLATALEHHPDDVPAALDDWEAHLRPAVEGKQRLGPRNATAHPPPTRLHLGARNVTMRLAATQPVQRFLRRHLQLEADPTCSSR